MQPFDAAAAVLDASLLGASETSYISAAMLVNSALTMLVLWPVTQHWPGLANVWLAAKIMTLGRITSGYWRFRSPQGRLNLPQVAKLPVA